MKYRKLSDSNDFQFGNGSLDYHHDTPDGVAQAVATRLRLLAGEWFVDTDAGVPYQTGILGTGTQFSRDAVIRDAVLNTQGVTGIDAYSSIFEPNSRNFSVSITITTVYGAAVLNEVL
jgi:hypothetical protein